MKSNNILAVPRAQCASADFDRFIDFFADMIEKYGAEVLDEIEVEDSHAIISVHTEKSTA